MLDGHVSRDRGILAMTGNEFIALLRKTRLRALLPALAMTVEKQGDVGMSRPTDFLIAETFTDSLARLAGEEEKA